MSDLQNLLDQIQRIDAELKQPVAHDQISFAERIEREDELAMLGYTVLPQLAKALQAVLAKCASMERGVGYRVSGHHDTWDSYHEGMSVMAGYIEEAITDALGADDD